MCRYRNVDGNQWEWVILWFSYMVEGAPALLFCVTLIVFSLILYTEHER